MFCSSLMPKLKASRPSHLSRRMLATQLLSHSHALLSCRRTFGAEWLESLLEIVPSASFPGLMEAKAFSLGHWM